MRSSRAQAYPTMIPFASRKTNIRTIVLGGTVHAPSHSLVGLLAEESVQQFRFTKAFLGTVGINLQEGFSQSNVEEIFLKRQVAARSREVIVLADSSKFNQDVLVMFLRLEQVHMVITDSGVRQQDRAALEERGIRVIVAEAGGGET